MTYIENTQDTHKSSFYVFWTSYAQPTYLLCPGGCTERHIDTYIHRKNVIAIILVADPGLLEHPFRVQIVSSYQSLTIATKTHTPGVIGLVDWLLNLIVIKKHLISNLHLDDSLDVSFTKQGSLNKEIKLNLRNICSIFIFNELYSLNVS